jgi:polyphenol oxidase
MISHQIDDIRYFTFDIFLEEAVKAMVFTRSGGVSPSPWKSLNVGGSVGDMTERVIENRKRSFKAAGRKIESIFDVWQVHSINVAVADAPRAPGTSYQKADIILTDKDDVTLFMRFADCVPILLFDPIQKAIGLVHAGWVGTVNQIAKAAVQVMHDRYGTDPVNLLAGIGPSICVDHYPVGQDVIEKVDKSFEKGAEGLYRRNGDQSYFDLWAANKLTLEQSGVKKIEIAGICTACDLENWYSHRGEKGNTGRFGVLFSVD